MNTVDAAIKSFPAWAQWVASWGMRLYPSYEWFIAVGNEEFPTSFTSDKFIVKARQVVFQNWEPWQWRVRKRGIVIEFTLEDVLLLKETDACGRVAALKLVLHKAIQRARVVHGYEYYPVFPASIVQEVSTVWIS